MALTWPLSHSPALAGPSGLGPGHPQRGWECTVVPRGLGSSAWGAGWVGGVSEAPGGSTGSSCRVHRWSAIMVQMLSLLLLCLPGSVPRTSPPPPKCPCVPGPAGILCDHLGPSLGAPTDGEMRLFCAKHSDQCRHRVSGAQRSGVCLEKVEGDGGTARCPEYCC